MPSELREESLGIPPLGRDISSFERTTDNDLVRDFISGNDAAFAQLVGKYKDSITNYVNMIIGDYDTSVDLSQETFLRVYRNINRYSNIYQFSTWIYRIATNLAIDELRFRKRRGRVFHRNVLGKRKAEEEGAPEFEVADVRADPRDEILRKESGRVVREAIRSLPEKYRTAFIMREVQELPYEEISAILKCSAGTIKSRLHRARELLQRKLEHYR
ncbi:MAG: sigma-70 family RNA polymerase sigma factor [Acidobacteria bacterium]|nr:sigma-70 family RNA polymerase sigma factor [Acidobacteriota bacterium]